MRSTVTGDDAATLMKLIDALEEDDDVQTVWGNYDVPDEELEKLGLIILGLDPGLGTTGWGIIRADGNRLSHLANGQLKTNAAERLPKRLSHLAAPA